MRCIGGVIKQSDISVGAFGAAIGIRSAVDGVGNVESQGHDIVQKRINRVQLNGLM